MAKNAERILIRAYFYSIINPAHNIEPPDSWSDFINQFVDYNKLNTQIGRELLRKYLVGLFKMEFESRENIAKLCDSKEVAALANNLESIKKIKALAENDALMAIYIYSRRQHLGETSEANEFGYRTWWLTGESRILPHTKYLEKKHGSGYMMRPEFALNFITLLPSASQVLDSYRAIFPTLIGIRLAKRIEPGKLHKILEDYNKAKEREPARLKAQMSHLSDMLKSDFMKDYGRRYKNLYGDSIIS